MPPSTTSKLGHLRPAAALRLFGATAIVLVAVLPAAADPPPVTLLLSSGRQMTGAIDSRTNDRQLWLRQGTDRAALLRPIDWERIEKAWVGGAALSRQQLRSQAPVLAEETPPPPRIGFDEELPPPTAHPQAAPAAARIPFRRVQSVHVEAALGRWGAGVESSGLVVRVLPLDEWGDVAASQAVVEVVLAAPRHRYFQDAPRSRGAVAETIGHWTRVVRPEEIGPGGAVLRLPFQAVHPELDDRTGSHALVHVRWAAAGSPVATASQEPVRIRPFSPLRDHWELTTGQRFLAFEPTDRSRSRTRP